VCWGSDRVRPCSWWKEGEEVVGRCRDVRISTDRGIDSQSQDAFVRSFSVRKVRK